MYIPELKSLRLKGSLFSPLWAVTFFKYTVFPSTFLTLIKTSCLLVELNEIVVLLKNGFGDATSLFTDFSWEKIAMVLRKQKINSNFLIIFIGDWVIIKNLSHVEYSPSLKHLQPLATLEQY